VYVASTIIAPSRTSASHHQPNAYQRRRVRHALKYTWVVITGPPQPLLSSTVRYTARTKMHSDELSNGWGGPVITTQVYFSACRTRRLWYALG
jgi:hypothetical protein